MTEKEKKARHLMELMGVRSSIRNMMSQMIQSMIETSISMGDNDFPPELTTEALDAFFELIQIEELADLHVPAFAKYYDEQYLDDTIAFYESPAGQAMVKKTPAMFAEINATTQLWMRNRFDILKNQIDEWMEKVERGEYIQSPDSDDDSE